MRDNFELPTKNPLPAEAAELLGAAAVAAETPAQPHRVRPPKPHKPAKAAEAEPDEGDEEPATSLDAEAASSEADLVRVYLREIGKVPLLNAVEEVELSKRIETGLFAETILDYRDGDDEKRAEIRQSILKGVTVRLKAEATRTQKSDGQKGSKTAKERTEAGQKADLEREKQAHRETETSMAAIARLAQDQTLTNRELKALITDGGRAKENLEKANLRLVVSLAKRYTGHGMDFLDLIQEGNLGVIRAVEKFDYTKGFKFSTYATWWIRQAITRSMADQSRTVRIPVHTVEQINKLARIRRELAQTLGRKPTEAELATELDMTPGKVRELQGYAQEPASLDLAVGDDSDATLGDFIADAGAPEAYDIFVAGQRNQILDSVIQTLDEREQTIIKMRFGIGYAAPMTLDEIGREFSLSRERIRQIEREVMAKLRHPSRKQILQDYLDD